MSNKWNNLQGFCRDLRAAALAAAEGNPEAEKLMYTLDDALGIFDAYVDGDMDGGPDSDADASGDESEDESDAPDLVAEERERQLGNVAGVGGVGRSPTKPAPRVFSTRARLAQEARPRPGQPVCRIGRGGRR